MSAAANHLVVVIDVKILCSTDSSRPRSANDVLAQILAFLNAYVLLQEHNKLLVFAVTATDCKVLYNSSTTGGLNHTDAQAPTTVIHTELQKTLAGLTTGGDVGDAAWAAALSRSLCWLTAQLKEHAALKPVILCLVASDDVPSQYVPVMNAIFAAQRHQVVVDACILGEHDSALLQQATHLTGGTYVRCGDASCMLQHLMQSFVVDSRCRVWLQPAVLPSVDFRAACFCHKKPCDIVHVCSVCMSIFCQPVPTCSTCGTRFKA